MDDVRLIARVAAVLADETRLRIIVLLSQQAATVSDLTARLDADQPRISSHLAILREAGLVRVEKFGRHAVYRLAKEETMLKTLESLHALGHHGNARPPSRAASREISRNSPIRQCRTCYDHLAGVAGVDLLRQMIARGWLTAVDGTRPDYHLTPEGARALAERGVHLEGANGKRRKFAYGCTDWTERQPHLGGALGAAVLAALLEDGWLARNPGTRVVTALKPLSDWLDGEANN